MKKTIILFPSVLLAIQMQALLKVDSNGKVSIGNTPSAKEILQKFQKDNL
ncbi:MAG: hypothetical protein IKH26_05225 [Bacteroidaceae bacterium]|nr:hypothetical protein [Bacteroidaceae bacterium]